MIIDHKQFKQSIRSSKDVADILIELYQKLPAFEKDKEYFYAIGITRRNTIRYIDLVSVGSLTGTLAEPREVYRMAIHKAVSSIIISHNHPSGNLIPSDADIKLTRKIKEAGKIISIQLIDHIIFSEEGHYSFANEGCL